MAAVGHESLLVRLAAELAADSQVMGVMVQGSVARGDHHAGSDLDLLVVLEEGVFREFRSEVIDGILVERHHGDPVTLRSKLARRPALAYGVRDGRILHDPDGALVELVRFTAEVLDGYRTPERELRDLRYWLYASRVKLHAALAAGDDLRAGFLASTTTWKALEGVWAVNDLPMPHGGAILAYLGDLGDNPLDSPLLVTALFEGTARERALTCCRLIDWFLEAVVA